MIKNDGNNEQIYGRNDMVMLDQNNKIYGSLGIADKYVLKTEEGTRLVLSNPKLGKFGDVLTEFNMYGRSEQKQYKGINLFPPDTNYAEYIEVSIPKGSSVFWATDGSPAPGGNFRFFNEDKTENMWFGVDAGDTSKVLTLSINAKYVQNLTVTGFDLSKICLGVGSKPIYEPYTGGQPSPSPDYPQEIKSVVNPTVKVSNGDGTESQTVQLPYTLNAIPVASGGNITIDGQQYIADYVDVQRGKVIRRINNIILTGEERWEVGFADWITLPHAFKVENLKANILQGNVMNANYLWYQKHANIDLDSMNSPYNDCIAVSDSRFSSVDEFTNELKKQNSNGTPLIAYYATNAYQEEDLTSEQIQALQELKANYPVTIIENNYSTWMKATYKSIESV